MTVILATRTIDAINTALYRDGGARWRGLLAQTMPRCVDAYRSEEEDEFRSHLGVSLIGRSCERELYYTFRWYTPRRPEPRLIRLFNRGHLEEGRMTALLQLIDCEVWTHDEHGGQFRVSDFGGHYGSALDTIARRCPDLDAGMPFLAEFKTHAHKFFVPLVKHGVLATNPEHYVQCQDYMGAYGLPAALYIAVNKNNDELYGEILFSDPSCFTHNRHKAARIIASTAPPSRISNSPGWYECKMCDHYNVCHKKAAPARNCRTCVHSAPAAQAQWSCSLHHQTLTKPQQLVGCDSYQVITP